MAHSNRKTRGEKKRAAKRAMKAANRSRFESLRDSNKNSKRAKANSKKNRQPGHPHEQPCGNIGCLKDSAIARKGYLYLLSKSVGPAKAKVRAEKLGWIVE